MKMLTMIQRSMTITLFLFAFAVPMTAHCQENQAEVILKTMSDYIGSQKSIELTFNSDIEIITPQLEKIQFTNSGTAVVNRPDKLYAHRMSGHAEVTMYFDGKSVSIYEKKSHGYVQFDTLGSIDQLLEALRNGAGVALPGADLLLSDSYEVLIADVMEAKYIGVGVIDGRECEHLAFRNFDTDWQIWVQTGKEPIPCKMVITSKTMNNAPQYTLHVKSWNAAATPENSFFVFSPPEGAEELDQEALIGFDELPPDSTK